MLHLFNLDRRVLLLVRLVVPRSPLIRPTVVRLRPIRLVIVSVAQLLQRTIRSLLEVLLPSKGRINRERIDASG